jgi:hypothetical protein
MENKPFSSFAGTSLSILKNKQNSKLAEFKNWILELMVRREFDC